MKVVHVLRRGVIGQHAFRTLAAQREHQQIAHARQQILDESSWLESADDHLLNHAVQRLAVLVGNRVDGLANQRIRREAQQRDGGIIWNLAVDRADHQLVKHGKRITHGTTAGPHGEAQHTRLRLDMLIGADALQIRTHDLLGHQAERIVVGTGANGADHLVRLGGGEDEHDVFRRLLDDFEQRVESLRCDHMGLVEDEDLVAVARRSESRAFPQLAGVIHAVVGCGVDFHHIDGTRTACGEVLAAGAFAARMGGGTLRAVHATGQNTRGTGFPTAARTGEQIRVRELVLVKRAHQRNGDLILPDHAVKCVGTIPSIQCQCHRVSFRSSATRLSINYDTQIRCKCAAAIFRAQDTRHVCGGMPPADFPSRPVVPVREACHACHRGLPPKPDGYEPVLEPRNALRSRTEPSSGTFRDSPAYCASSHRRFPPLH